ncbi:MAG: hypothetical protein ACOC0R_02875 [Mariniphaga sp.]
MSKKNITGLLLAWLVSLTAISQDFSEYPHDTLLFQGQVSGWGLYNPDITPQVMGGGRFIPQANYEFHLRPGRLIDFEASVNAYGSTGANRIKATADGDIKPYRLWARYASPQLELRGGLQKINFGSASMLRPLMWFDQIDPRDPLQLTDGVWGMLGRYYFLNNMNIWAWALYGNNDTKGWEVLETKKNTPEFGGRVQTPVPFGEAALSYHHRKVKGTGYGPSPADPGKTILENRLGFDARLDMVVGWWLEASWTHKGDDLSVYTNQEIINMGLDYTFGIGSGLTVIYEHLIAAYDQKAFSFLKPVYFSLVNLSYPIGLFDNLSAIVYYDWSNNKTYNFINWNRQYNNFSFYLMGFLNPKSYKIPTQESTHNLYAGSGVHLMLVFNY